MGHPHDHPYRIDIRPVQGLPGHYTYSIHERRAPRRHSRMTYPSFDAARAAAQAMLQRLVFEHWLVGQKPAVGGLDRPR